MSQRILLVNENSTQSKVMEQALKSAGYVVAGHIPSFENMASTVQTLQPDAIVIGVIAPDTVLFDQIKVVDQQSPRPIIMFVEKSDSKTIEDAVRTGIHSFVVNGFDKHRLKSVIEVAVARFKDYQALREELEKTKTTLEERKLIERAKGILIAQKNWSEDQAYKALRKMAMDKNVRIGDVARNIVDVASLLT